VKMRASAVGIIGLLLLTPALAQTPPATPAAPVPRDVHLLDDVPDYATILVHQWSDGLPQDAVDAEHSTERYGRLLEGAPVQAVSVADCIALAVQNNTDLQIQRLGPINATAQVRSSRAVFDPVLFADATRDRKVTPATTFLTAGGANSLFTQNFNFDAGLRKTLLSGGQLALSWQNQRLLTNPSVLATLVPQYTTSLGLSLNQPLLRDFGWRHALLVVEVAQATEQQAYQQYKAQIATIIAQVEHAYWALVLATDAVRVEDQGIALAREVLRQNEDKFNVGSLPRTAVLEAQAEVARREASLIQARNQLDIARDNLRALINHPTPDSSALLMVEPQDKPTVVPYEINLQRSLQTALEQRPELAAARLDVHGKGLQRKVAENQLLPKLNFAGAIGLNGLSGTDSHATFDLGGAPIPVQTNPSLVGGYGQALELLHDGRYYNYSAGVSVEIPIDNAQAKAGYAQANIGLDQSRLALQKLEEGVTLEIKTAVSNLQSDLKSIDATRIARELAEENVRNQQGRYDVGLATTKDMLDFQNLLIRARFAEIQALTAYNSALAELRRADGTLLSARNVLIERVDAEKARWWASF
jgi:outer membrane protein